MARTTDDYASAFDYNPNWYEDEQKKLNDAANFQANTGDFTQGGKGDNAGFDYAGSYPGANSFYAPQEQPTRGNDAQPDYSVAADYLNENLARGFANANTPRFTPNQQPFGMPSPVDPRYQNPLDYLGSVLNTPIGNPDMRYQSQGARNKAEEMGYSPYRDYGNWGTVQQAPYQDDMRYFGAKNDLNIGYVGVPRLPLPQSSAQFPTWQDTHPGYMQPTQFNPSGSSVPTWQDTHPGWMGDGIAPQGVTPVNGYTPPRPTPATNPPPRYAPNTFNRSGGGYGYSNYGGSGYQARAAEEPQAWHKGAIQWRF